MCVFQCLDPPKNIYVEIVEIVDAKICKNTKKQVKIDNIHENTYSPAGIYILNSPKRIIFERFQKPSAQKYAIFE